MISELFWASNIAALLTAFVDRKNIPGTPIFFNIGAITLLHDAEPSSTLRKAALGGRGVPSR